MSEDVWEERPLGSLLSSMETGSRPRGGVRGITDGIPSLGGEHLNELGGLNFNNVRFVPQSFYDSMRRGHIQRGDVLVVKDGATTGKVSFVGDNFPYERAVANEHLFVCRPRSVDGKYLFWYLYSDEGQRRILDHFRGSAQGGITRDFADGTLVPVAPTRVLQERLAHFLATAFARRLSADKHLGAAHRAIVDFKHSVLAAACSGRLTADWREGGGRSVSGDLVSATSLAQPTYRDIPPSWTIARVGDIGTVQLGGTPSRQRLDYWNGGIAWVSSGEVANCRIAVTRETISPQGLANSSAKIYPAGTVLIAMIGEGKTRGQAAILDIEAATNQNAAGIVADRRLVDPEYLWRWALAEYETTRAVGTGGNQPALNKQRVADLIVAVPPLDEQAVIVQLVDRLLRSIDEFRSRIDTASHRVERSSQAVLAKAFHGELNGAKV